MYLYKYESDFKFWKKYLMKHKNTLTFIPEVFYFMEYKENT